MEIFNGFPPEKPYTRNSYQNAVHGANNTAHYRGTKSIKFLGWRKPCKCLTEEVKPCVVLDPFSGSGTTVRTAVKNNRTGWGIELNPEYIAISDKHSRDLQVKLF